MALQVMPGENAVLVVLLSTVTALAVHDLLGTMSRKPVKVTKKKMFPDKADWGMFPCNICQRSMIGFHFYEAFYNPTLQAH
jgi:hypothetical protein